MPAPLDFIVLALATVVAYHAFQFTKLLCRELNSPLYYLPGPRRRSFLFGSFQDIWSKDIGATETQWFQEYGRTFSFSGFFGAKRLLTSDTKAISHIFMNSYRYAKPEFIRTTLIATTGPGLLTVENDIHRQQRRILNPAFGPAQIRDLTEAFVAKSNQLRDIWANLCDGRPTRINVVPWYARATLDIIGRAGFDYSFDSLDSSETPSELHKQLLSFFQKNSTIRPTARRRTMALLSGVLPLEVIFEILTYIQRRKFTAGLTMERIGRSKLEAAKSDASGAEKALDDGRSIFSLLVKANLSLTEKGEQRMSDADVLAQVPTFLVAGHETTSTALSWTLLALSQQPDAQQKLRDELFTLQTETPTMDDLNGLPYLDMVIRESLRLYAPVPMGARVAQQDDVIPLSQPYKDTRGVWHDSIEIKEGQTVHIPISHINCDEELWGPDALLFRPERWEALPAAVTSIPGVWGNMLTFFGGAHSCIGYRFSIVEMKAFLFSLLRAFEFELAVPVEDVGKSFTPVIRPVLRSEPDAGCQLPMIVKPLQRTSSEW